MSIQPSSLVSIFTAYYSLVLCLLSLIYPHLLFRMARRNGLACFTEWEKGVAFRTQKQDHTMQNRFCSWYLTIPSKMGCASKRNENFGEAASGKLHFGA